MVTVNDYLARRDAEWMSPIFNFLGMNVGHILTTWIRDSGSIYGCDITTEPTNESGLPAGQYGAAPELRVQRGFYYCIVDELTRS